MRARHHPSTVGAWILVAALVPAVAGAADRPVSSRAFDDPALQWGPCPDFMPTGCAIALLHGDPAGPESDVFFRVPPGAQIPVHWHTAGERMVLVDGRLKVQYDGAPPVTLVSGTYAYGEPGRAHSAVCESPRPCVLFIAFDAPIDAFAGRPDAR